MNRDKAPVDASDVDDVPHAARIASLAACAFALAVVLNPVAGTAMAASGLCLLLFSFGVRGESVARVLPDFRLAAAVIAVALVAILVPGSIVGNPPAWMSGALPSVVLILGAWPLFTKSDNRQSSVAAAAVIVAGLVTGALLIWAASDVGIDVVLLHQAAASALARGQDIYGPAVTVPNGAPGLPVGSMIVGYPYPPVAAVAYAASMWLLGDPRWMNLLAWVVLAVCTAVLFVCRERRFLPFLTIAAIPGWAAMLQNGWTEMLSAAAIAVAAVSWRHTSASGIALGLALGSKQYFAIALPLILLHKDGWRRRAPVALATAAATLAPAFLQAPADAWRAMILSHAHAPARMDSANLSAAVARFGYSWAAPAWVAIGVGAILFGILARRASTPAAFWRAFAAGLAAFFLFSSQAMPNYWYLVAVTAAIGCTRDGSENAV